MSISEFVACIVFITLSAFLSSTEVSLFSLSRFQLRQIKENIPSIFKRMQEMLSDTSGFLITILITNEVINVSLATIVATVITRNWESFSILTQWEIMPEWTWKVVAEIVIVSPILLILCEITPKLTAARINQVIAPLFASPIHRIYRFFYPIRKLLKLFGFELGNREAVEARLKEDDFLIIAEEGQREGNIDKSELGLIRNIFDLDDRKVSEIQISVGGVHSFRSETTVREALKYLQSSRFYRMPVYSKNKRNVVGILYTKDLIVSKLDPQALNSRVESLMRLPFFVDSNMHISTLFKQMKENKKHLVVVRNSRKEATGIVTMDDILKSLFRPTERFSRRLEKGFGL